MDHHEPSLNSWQLAASHEQLTIAEFASVIRKDAKRGDVAKLLEEYDNQ